MLRFIVLIGSALTFACTSPEEPLQPNARDGGSVDGSAVDRDAGDGATDLDGGSPVLDAGPRDGGTPDTGTSCDGGIPLCIDGRCAAMEVEAVAHFGQAFTAIWSASATEVFLGTDSGSIFVYNGTDTSLSFGGDATITALHGTSATDVWATDDAGRVHHFDGTAWNVATNSPEALHAVFALAANRVFAAGDGIFLTYDGSGWATQTIGVRIVDIWASAPNDVHVLGTFNLNVNNTIARHYDGNAWTQRTLAGEFTGLTGLDASNVFAAGPGGIRRFDGTTWGLYGRTSGHVDVEAGPNGDLFPVGYRPHATRLVGTATTAQANALGIRVERVSVAADGTAWIIGRTALHRFAYEAVEARIDTRLRGGGIIDVWGWSPDDVVAVGFDGTMWRRSASGWREIDSRTRRTLLAVVADGPDDVMAVGSGTVVRGPLADLRVETIRGFPSLTAVSRAGDGSAFIVGDDYIAHEVGGTLRTITDETSVVTGFWSADGNVTWVSGFDDLYRYDGTHWERQFVDAGWSFYSIFGFADDDIYAGGRGNGIWHYDGRTWSQALPSRPGTVTGLWGSGPSDVYAVGSIGIQHFDGAIWSPLFVGVTGGVTDVWGTHANNVWITDGASVHHYDGQTWTATALPGNPQLEAIWGSNASNVFAVGRGVAFRFDGSRWRSVALPSGEELTDVHGRSSTEIFAVSNDGNVLEWNGSMFVGSASGFGGLRAVWVAPNGDTYTGGIERPLRRRFNSSAWQMIAPQGDFQSVWTANQNFAVIAEGLLHRGAFVFEGAGLEFTNLIEPGTSLRSIFGWGTDDVLLASYTQGAWRYDGATWQTSSNQALLANELHGATPRRTFGVGGHLTVYEDDAWRMLVENFDGPGAVSGAWAASDEELYLVARGDVVRLHCR